MSRKIQRSGAFVCLFGLIPLAAADFAPGPNPISGAVTTAQTLGTASGTVNAGGSIVTAGGTTLTMTGTTTLTNNGTIQNTGSGRAIDSNSGTANLTVVNTGTIKTVSSDAFRVNTAASSVSLTNSGTIQVTAGGQALDWAAIATGANTVTNQAGGTIGAVGEDAIRPGNNGVVINAGTIVATPTISGGAASGSDAVDLRTNRIVKVTNTGTITGRSGIATDGDNTGPSLLTVENDAGVIEGVNGSGLNVDGVNTTVKADVTNAQGATIRGGVLSTTTDADGDGIDIDGVLTLNNSGKVLGLGSKGGTNNAEGIAAGGGSITNMATGEIVGSSLAADAPNGDTSRAGNGILIDNSDTGDAIAATTVVNAGLIQGKTGFAIRIIGSFADTITNQAGGTIRGAGTAGTSGAAIQTGGGADTLNNSGAIVGENGLAVDLEAGDDAMHVLGGSIVGDVSGGAGNNTLDFDAAAGFSYAGVLSNFASVEIKSGAVTLSGASTYSGNTVVSAGSLMANNTAGSATGTGVVTVKSGATLGGSGAVGKVVAESGSAIAPGSDVGTLKLAELAIVGGAHLRFDLGASSDLLNVAGPVSFSGSGTAVFDIAGTGIAVGSDYTLVTFANAVGFDTSKVSLGSVPPGLQATLQVTSTSVVLHVPDTTPNAFSFVDQRDVVRGTVRTSNAVVVSGITGAARIAAIGGTYSIGCDGQFTSAPGLVANGQKVCVRHTASSRFDTSVDTTLDVGGVRDTFTSTTYPNAVAELLGTTVKVVDSILHKLL